MELELLWFVANARKIGVDLVERATPGQDFVIENVFCFCSVATLDVDQIALWSFGCLVVFVNSKTTSGGVAETWARLCLLGE